MIPRVVLIFSVAMSVANSWPAIGHPADTVDLYVDGNCQASGTGLNPQCESGPDGPLNSLPQQIAAGTRLLAACGTTLFLDERQSLYIGSSDVTLTTYDGRGREENPYCAPFTVSGAKRPAKLGFLLKGSSGAWTWREGDEAPITLSLTGSVEAAARLLATRISSHPRYGSRWSCAASGAALECESRSHPGEGFPDLGGINPALTGLGGATVTIVQQKPEYLMRIDGTGNLLRNWQFIGFPRAGEGTVLQIGPGSQVSMERVAVNARGARSAIWLGDILRPIVWRQIDVQNAQVGIHVAATQYSASMLLDGLNCRNTHYLANDAGHEGDADCVTISNATGHRFDTNGTFVVQNSVFMNYCENAVDVQTADNLIIRKSIFYPSGFCTGAVDYPTAILAGPAGEREPTVGIKIYENQFLLDERTNALGTRNSTHGTFAANLVIARTGVTVRAYGEQSADGWLVAQNTFDVSHHCVDIAASTATAATNILNNVCIPLSRGRGIVVRAKAAATVGANAFLGGTYHSYGGHFLGNVVPIDLNSDWHRDGLGIDRYTPRPGSSIANRGWPTRIRQDLRGCPFDATNPTVGSISICESPIPK